MARVKVIKFKEILLKDEKNLFNVYYVEINSRSKFLDGLDKLEEKKRDEVITLIQLMAEKGRNLKSPKIRWKLENYRYGELKPKGHRFFFFMKFGDNIIFFNYKIKKKQNLKAEEYKRLQKEMEEYAEEFRR